MNYEEFSAAQNERLTAVLASLDSDQLDKESVKTSFKDLLKTQDEYGKTSYSKKAAQVNKYLDMLNKLGYDKEVHANPEDFLAKFEDKTKTIETQTSAYQVLEARLKKIESEKLAETERAETLKSENERATIETKLTKALDAELKGTKYIVKDLIADKKVKLVDGEVVFMDGENVVLFEDGIKKIIEDNEDLRKVSIKPGAGSTSKVIKDNVQGSLSLEAINKMSPAEIKANMAAIKKSVGMR